MMVSLLSNAVPRQRCGIYTLALLIAALSCFAPGFDAATTGRKPTQPILPTDDQKPKDSSRRVMDPAFAKAGQKPGLEIWRIENFKPVAYKKGDYGKFYTGDSYIVLFTKEKNGVKSWDIHFWLGLETSQDESGAAAILSVQLDDQLGGTPIQYREVQEHESQLFLSHFKSGVRYMPGGVASGFQHVDRNKHDKVLYQVKGKRNIRVKQVDVSIASMNKGDCFILDIGTDVYAFIGPKAKRAERLKAISASNQIRDQDHGGRAKVHIIDEYSPPAEIDKFFKALGEGSMIDIPDENAGGDDEAFENGQEKAVTLYRISDASGKLKVEQVGQKPLLQSYLDTNDCFILDTSDSNLYVWVGKKCTANEKSQAMVKANDFLKQKKYPAWTQIQRVVEFGEPTSFQQYFKTWKAPAETHTRLIRSVDTSQKKLDVKSSGTAQEFMPDTGNGEVEVFRIENMELAPIPKENYGMFFGGDSYVVRYKTTKGKYVLYIWQGKQSSKDEKSASAFQAVKLDDEVGGHAIQIRVTQDNEPKHFMHIFKGKLVTFLGGKASGFKNLHDHDTYLQGETRMYRIRGTDETNVRATQQIPEAKYLASDDVFFVETDKKSWIWQGSKSDAIERKLAADFARIIAGVTNAEEVPEGAEHIDFWNALGGRDDYNENFANSLRPPQEPQMVHAIIDKRDKLRLEVIENYEQDDLVEDDVMLIDDGYIVYVWIGKGADAHERKYAMTMANKYLLKYDREESVIVVQKQGEESDSLKKLFPSWDADLWKKQK